MKQTNVQWGQTLDRTVAYQSPAIIYEGILSTRAGSPIGPRPGVEDPSTNAVDLFEDPSD